MLVLGIGRVLLDELRQTNGIIDLHTHVPQSHILPQLAVHKLSTRLRFTLSLGMVIQHVLRLRNIIHRVITLDVLNSPVSERFFTFTF